MIEVKCEVCGKVVRRSPSKVHNHVFCSHECWKTMASAMWTEDQRDAVRRREKKNKGDCKAGTYPKFHGRHEHRVVAERMLGRLLRPGEVVHHINGDTRDNRPENLMVFRSGKEHTEYHAAHPEESGVTIGQKHGRYAGKDSPFHRSVINLDTDVIGLDEIQESPFRYCCAADFNLNSSRLLEFLTACCFYPRQIEMLMKAGMKDVVTDLVDRGVKHATVIDWDDPKKAFKLNRQDMKTFLGTNRDIRILELHKRLKGRIPLTQCAEWISRGIDIQRTVRAAKKWNIPLEKLIRYLDGYVGCAQYGGMSSLSSALRFWEDYLTAAEAMGYLLHRENVLLPRNLGEAHDEATKKHQAKLERERAAQRRE